MLLWFALLLFLGFFTNLNQVCAYKCDEVVLVGGSSTGKTASELGLPCTENDGLTELEEDEFENTGVATTSLRETVMNVINYFLTFLGLLCVIIVIYSGFLMVTAMGDEEQYSKGKQGLGYMVIGILLILMSYAIVGWVFGVLGEGEPVTVDWENPVVETGGGDGGGGGTSYYVDNYYYDVTDGVPVDLSDIRSELDAICDEMGSEVSEEINNFIENLDNYINNPGSESWNNFYEEYEEFINQYGDVVNWDDLSDYSNVTSDLSSLEEALEDLRGEISSDDYEELMEKYEEYIENSTEWNWEDFEKLYEDLAEFYKDGIEFPDMPEYEDLTRELNQIESIIESMKGKIGTDDYRELRDLFLEYKSNPSESNWNELLDFYQDLVAQYTESLGSDFQDFPEYRDVDEELKSYESMIEWLRDDLSSSDYAKLKGLFDEYMRNPTEYNWERFYEFYDEVRTEYGGQYDFPELPDYKDLQRDLEKLGEITKKLQRQIGQFDFEVAKAGFTLNDVEEALVSLEEEFEDYALDTDLLREKYDAYTESPSKTTWSDFVEAYEEFWEEVEGMESVKTIINAKPSSGKAPLSVVLDGLKSTDPGGETIPDSHYTWTYIDAGGNEVTLEHKAVVVADFMDPGSYIVNLKAESAAVNEAGKKIVLDGYATKKIVVDSPSTLFDLKIDDDELTTYYKTDLNSAKQGLKFDISGTQPPLGRTFVKHEWNFGDVTTGDYYDMRAIEHAYGVAGEYTVEITLTDDADEKHRKEFTLLIKDLVAVPIVTPDGGTLGTEFHFSGSKSKPISDQIVEYVWKIIDEEGDVVLESENEEFDYELTEPGVYEVELTVRDSSEGEDEETIKLDVESRKPKAAFEWKEMSESSPNTILYDALDSFDYESDKLLYSWDFDGDGKYDLTEQEKHLAEYTFDEAGRYKTKLKVTDAYENSDEKELEIEIASTLVVDFVPSVYAVAKGQEITFKWVAENIEAYYWDFGEGKPVISSETETIKHTFETADVFEVTLKVFDENWDSNSVTRKIYVGDADVPIAAIDYLVDGAVVNLENDLCGAGKDGVVVYRNSKVGFSAAKSANISGKHEKLEYIWDFGDGVYGAQKEIPHYFNEVTGSKCVKISLKVKDEESGKVSAGDELYVQVQNSLPRLSFLEVKPEGEMRTPATFKLYARGVKDADGKVVKYRWWYYKQGDSKERGVKTTSTDSTTMTVMGDGLPGQKNNFYFVVELTDDTGGVVNSDELLDAEVAYEVENGKNVSPIVDFSVDKSLLYTGDSVNFYATAEDPQGGVIPKNAYKWDFDWDGEFDDVSSGRQVSRKYNLPGEYEVRLKVDLNGLSTSKTKKIIVKRLNEFPEAAFVYTVEGLKVLFDANNSRYDDSLKDKELWYSWDFDAGLDENGNGIKEDDDQDNGVIAEHEYAGVGNYRVRLTVKDNEGGSDVVERTIVIGEKDAHSSAGGSTRNDEMVESLKLESEGLFSSLTLSMQDVTLNKGDMVDILARIIQASGETYSDAVNYRIIEGSGKLIPEDVKARMGVAMTTFQADAPGLVIVEVTVPVISGGPLQEEIAFEVE